MWPQIIWERAEKYWLRTSYALKQLLFCTSISPLPWGNSARKKCPCLSWHLTAAQRAEAGIIFFSQCLKITYCVLTFLYQDALKSTATGGGWKVASLTAFLKKTAIESKVIVVRALTVELTETQNKLIVLYDLISGAGIQYLLFSHEFPIRHLSHYLW